jgi:hypothetical protein
MTEEWKKRGSADHGRLSVTTRWSAGQMTQVGPLLLPLGRHPLHNSLER